MSKNLRHLTSVHEAAQELHKLLLGSPWYVACQVLSRRHAPGAVTTKQHQQEIVVTVTDVAATAGALTDFNSWPVRYVPRSK